MLKITRRPKGYKAKKLTVLEQVAVQLAGIATDDLSTAEKNICEILVKAGVLLHHKSKDENCYDLK